MTNASTAESAPLNIQRILSRYGILLAILAMGLGLSLADKYFLTIGNLTNVMVQVSVNGLLATGMTFVIIAGGIDLAVGSVLALSGMVFANYALSTTILPIGVAVMIGVLVGAATGVASEVMVAFFRMPAFVATLAMMSIARGLVKLYSRGGSIPGPSGSLNVNPSIFSASGAFSAFPCRFLSFSLYLPSRGLSSPSPALAATSTRSAATNGAHG